MIGVINLPYGCSHHVLLWIKRLRKVLHLRAPCNGISQTALLRSLRANVFTINFSWLMMLVRWMYCHS